MWPPGIPPTVGSGPRASAFQPCLELPRWGGVGGGPHRIPLAPASVVKGAACLQDKGGSGGSGHFMANLSLPVHRQQHEGLSLALPLDPPKPSLGEKLCMRVSSWKAGLGARDGGLSLFLPTDLLCDFGRISPPL